MPASMSDAPKDPFGWVGATADGKYQIEQLVGEGGFGVVYRAHHLGFGEQVAFKCLRVPPELSGVERERFFESFLAEGKLQHRLSRMTAGIVQALDVGAAVSPSGAWTPYLVLEWLNGRSLEDDMDERHRLGMRGRPLHEALTLLDPVARALEVAHEQGVAHRDVKPANLFLAEIGGRQTIKVLDFGIAKVITETASVTQAFESTGRTLQAFTAHYGAPEQFARRFGATGPWTDVFALGLVLVELVSGKRALEGEDAAELFVSAADKDHRPTLRARGVECDDALEAVLEVALAVEPKERFRTMGEFWDSLCDVAGYVARAPMSSAHAALLPADLPPMSQPLAAGDVDRLLAPTLTGEPKIEQAPPKPGESSTQLSSSTQVPVEPAPRPKVATTARSGRSLVAGVAIMSLAAGLVVGGVAYLLRSRPSQPMAASGAPAASSAPSAVASVSAAPRAIPAPAPRTIVSGVVPGTNLWVEQFKLQSLPADTGATLMGAQIRCADAGLSLCTEQQWARACAELPDVGKQPSWTLTAQTHGFVVRGGGACTPRAVASGSDSAPDRRGLCCERGVAVESTNPNKNFLVATARQLEKIEAAINARRSSVFLGLVSDGTTIDGEPHTVQQIGRLLDESYQRYPDQWTIIDTCSVSMKPVARPPKTRKKKRRAVHKLESSSWSAECEVLRQRSGEISLVTTSYVIGGSGRIQAIDDIRTSRPWSKP